MWHLNSLGGKGKWEPFATPPSCFSVGIWNQLRNLFPSLPKIAKTITNQALDGPFQLQWSMTAFKVWTWHFNLFVTAMLLSNCTAKINMHKTNKIFYVTWILINLYISLYMEGHLVLASRGIMSYYAWIFFTKKIYHLISRISTLT